MLSRMTPLTKLMLIATMAGGLFFGFRQAVYYGLVQPPPILKTLLPIKAQDIDIKANILSVNTSNVKIVGLPSSTPATPSGPVVKFEVWAWNSQFGLMFANGGIDTTKGSLMESQRAYLHLIRQDDVPQMQNDLYSFAEGLQSNPQPTSGANYVVIMADGAAAFLQGINPKLEKLGPEYIAEVVGTTGYSRGEDQFMGLPSWKTNPASAKGGLIAGVIRDGDWNIAMRWAQINGIPNNPDETVYDPEALNWVGTNSYTDASQKYISNYCVELPIKGKPSEKKKVCVNGVVTWTPGDVMVAEKRGGLVTLMSTKTAIWQMPSAIIGIKKWNAANAETVAGMLAAIGQGADQLRANPAAFERAAQVSAEVYKEESPEYWARYYRGVTKKDAQGIEVSLGGSYASNLNDAEQLFGLSGGPNIFKVTYETWGNVDIQQYPNIMKEYPKTEDILNTRYLQMAKARVGSVQSAPAEQVSYSTTDPLKEVVGKRAYSITFKTGSAEILPTSFGALNQIAGDLITSNTAVIVHGHTDNTGTSATNEALSASRAESVKRFLMERGGNTIPSSRIRTVAHGQDEPVASNTTEAGRSKNRRVEIVLGTL